MFTGDVQVIKDMTSITTLKLTCLVHQLSVQGHFPLPTVWWCQHSGIEHFNNKIIFFRDALITRTFTKRQSITCTSLIGDDDLINI